ncbi:hypothetical protein C8A03DRAFT_46711 [Achaetomium macrosporum]|uniref:Uncharacterized protein n=1 Tax=Achaetomium macrosporum TaxID=79813 RepID=A0AAN7H8E9_9PEZI|nr:hypothetical protein C8A03DRAFT_46711 [Achaetomium macrosporum]
MRLLSCLAAFIAAPLSAVAIPTSNATIAGQPTVLLFTRQMRAPPPCTEARFAAFVEAFVGKSKNITKTFEYIAEDYINHNPMTRNGSAAAWSILSPIWQNIQHTYLRSTIKGNMSWVNYRAGGIGEVVDRFQWEASCIAEHWDQGEQYPSS